MAAAMTDADSLQCLDERIRAVSKALKRKICAAEAESVATQHATLLTYIWSGYDMGAAASFLRGKRSPERTTEELEDEVTAFFLTTPSQELGTMSMEPSGPNAAHAARHVVEWRLFLWLREQNCKHGVAPSRLQLVRHALLQVPEGLPAEREERVRRPLGGAARAQRKWLRRFRRGWAAKLGQLPIAPPVPVHQLQEKDEAFNWSVPPKVALSLPAAGQAAAMFPRRRKVNVAWLQEELAKLKQSRAELRKAVGLVQRSVAARQLSRDDLKLLMDAKEKPEEGVEGFLLWLPGRLAEARGEMPLKRVRLTTQRKRAACGELRALASELGVQDDNLRLDMTAEQFRRAAGRLVESCATPDQRRQLERAVNRYQNIVVPPLPGRAAENARCQGEEAGVEEGVTPHASPCTARGPSVRDALNRGHFYVFADKQGTLEVATSGWVPWSDYSVKGWWIDNLWTEHKLRHDVYLDYACKIRVGFSGRQRQVESVRAYECAAAFQQKQQEIAGRLELLKRPFRPDVLEALRPWANQYAELKMRYKFLVLRGGSQTGKSTLAKSLGDAFGWRPPYVQTVQSAPAPDLKEFQREEHGYILFDNVNHMDFVLNERALFQSNNDIHTLGSSRTGIYSYPVWLFQMPLVVTVDLSAEWNSSELWLADNMFEVFLESPCYT
ncbi:unnamed protein product [Effrenium voratum]|nr:unnamed protein product [Effrenium voratum]